MYTLVLRLTLPLAVMVMVLVLLTPVVARLLPPTQVIPIVTFNSPILLLVDVNRHMAAVRRTNPDVVFDAVVSPDQQHIAFSMLGSQGIQIYAGGLYDSQVQRITTDTMGGTNPAWAPDSNQIAFVGLEPDNKRGVYTVAVDGSSPLQTIVKAGTYASPAWSPDGQFITFASTHYRDLPDLYVVNSGCRQRCDRDMVQITNELVVDTIPVWSPDGSLIAFLSDRSGAYEIYELDMNCLQADQPKCSLQTPRRLRLRRPIVPFLMLWSLDGREVYFRALDIFTHQAGLYAVKADCVGRAEGCQPRLIYNLAGVMLVRRGSS